MSISAIDFVQTGQEDHWWDSRPPSRRSFATLRCYKSTLLGSRSSERYLHQSCKSPDQPGTRLMTISAVDFPQIGQNHHFKLNSNPYHYKLKFPLTSKQKFNSKFQGLEQFRVLGILNKTVIGRIFISSPLTVSRLSMAIRLPWLSLGVQKGTCIKRVSVEIDLGLGIS